MFCHIPSPKTREISFIKWERNLMLFNVTSTIFKCYPNIMRTTILMRQEPQKNSFSFHLDPHFLTLRDFKKWNNICKKHSCLLLENYIKDYIMVFMYVFTLLQRVILKAWVKPTMDIINLDILNSTLINYNVDKLLQYLRSIIAFICVSTQDVKQKCFLIFLFWSPI